MRWPPVTPPSTPAGRCTRRPPTHERLARGDDRHLVRRGLRGIEPAHDWHSRTTRSGCLACVRAGRRRGRSTPWCGADRDVARRRGTGARRSCSAGACGRDLAFREDESIDIVAPANRSTVRLPVEVRWTDTHDGEVLYAVFVDRAPIRPGQSLRSIGNDDPACRNDPGCPDAAYLARQRIYLVDEPRLVIDALDDLRTSGRGSEKDATRPSSCASRVIAASASPATSCSSTSSGTSDRARRKDQARRARRRSSPRPTSRRRAGALGVGREERRPAPARGGPRQRGRAGTR